MGIDKIVVEDYQELSEQAAAIVEQRIKAKPDLVLGLATGSTPVGLYKRLVADYQAGAIDLSQVTTFNLDEYCGLASDHPQSYRFFMDKHLFSQVNIDRRRVNFPREGDEDEYDRKITAAGGIDLQILGIGRNGHIGFNEPGSSFESRTRVVDLTKTTMADNARFFNRPEDVPRRAVTMGLATIMEAKTIILLASGESKAEVMKVMLAQRPAEGIPASILQRHKQVVIIVDREAGGGEKRTLLRQKHKGQSLNKTQSL